MASSVVAASIPAGRESDALNGRAAARSARSSVRSSGRRCTRARNEARRRMTEPREQSLRVVRRVGTCCAISSCEAPQMAAPFSRARRVEAHGTPLQAVHKSPRARYRGRCCARIGRIWDVQFKRSASRAAAAQELKYTIIRPRGRWSWGPSPSPSPATPPDSPAVYITRPSPPPPWRGMACGAVQELASCRSWFVLIDHHMYHDVQYNCITCMDVCILVMHAPRVDGKDSRWQVQRAAFVRGAAAG